MHTSEEVEVFCSTAADTRTTEGTSEIQYVHLEAGPQQGEVGMLTVLVCHLARQD
jgi:hypothetical protein